MKPKGKGNSLHVPRMETQQRKIEDLPPHLVLNVLQYVNFSGVRRMLKRDTTLEVSINQNKLLYIKGITCSHFDGDEVVEGTNRVKYLYGYFENDESRTIYLVHQNITLNFRLEEKKMKGSWSGEESLSVEHLVPRGTKRLVLNFDCENPIVKEEKLVADLLDFSTLPTGLTDLIVSFPVSKEQIGKIRCPNLNSFAFTLKKGENKVMQKSFWDVLAGINRIKSDGWKLCEFAPLQLSCHCLDFRFVDGEIPMGLSTVVPHLRRLDIKVEWGKFLISGVQLLSKLPLEELLFDITIRGENINLIRDYDVENCEVVNKFRSLDFKNFVMVLLDKNLFLKKLRIPFLSFVAKNTQKFSNDRLEALEMEIYDEVPSNFFETIFACCSKLTRLILVQGSGNIMRQRLNLGRKPWKDLGSFMKRMCSIFENIETILGDESLRSISSNDSIETLELIFWNQKLSEKFIESINENMTSLKNLKLGCRNIKSIFKTVVLNNNVEHLEITGKDANDHFPWKSLKNNKSIKYLFGNFSSAIFPFLRDSCPFVQEVENRNEFWSSRWSRNNQLEDPFKQFTVLKSSKKLPEDNDHWMKKSIIKWNLKKPHIKTVNWKKYYNSRMKLDDRDYIQIGDYDEDISRSMSESYIESHRKGIQKCVDEDCAGFISKYETECLINSSYFRKIKDNYYGFEYGVRIYSICGTGQYLDIAFDFHFRSRSYGNEDFTVLQLVHPIMEYKHLGDTRTRNGWTLFSKGMGEAGIMGLYEHKTCELMLLKKIENLIFGEEKFLRKGSGILMKLFFHLSGCNVEFSYGDGDETEDKYNYWMLYQFSKEYCVPIPGCSPFDELEYDDYNPPTSNFEDFSDSDEEDVQRNGCNVQ